MDRYPSVKQEPGDIDHPALPVRARPPGRRVGAGSDAGGGDGGGDSRVGNGGEGHNGGDDGGDGGCRGGVVYVAYGGLGGGLRGLPLGPPPPPLAGFPGGGPLLPPVDRPVHGSGAQRLPLADRGGPPRLPVPDRGGPPPLAPPERVGLPRLPPPPDRGGPPRLPPPNRGGPPRLPLPDRGGLPRLPPVDHGGLCTATEDDDDDDWPIGRRLLPADLGGGGLPDHDGRPRMLPYLAGPALRGGPRQLPPNLAGPPDRGEPPVQGGPRRPPSDVRVAPDRCRSVVPPPDRGGYQPPPDFGASGLPLDHGAGGSGGGGGSGVGGWPAWAAGEGGGRGKDGDACDGSLYRDHSYRGARRGFGRGGGAPTALPPQPLLAPTDGHGQWPPATRPRAAAAATAAGTAAVLGRRVGGAGGDLDLHSTGSGAMYYSVGGGRAASLGRIGSGGERSTSGGGLVPDFAGDMDDRAGRTSSGHLSGGNYTTRAPGHARGSGSAGHTAAYPAACGVGVSAVVVSDAPVGRSAAYGAAGATGRSGGYPGVGGPGRGRVYPAGHNTGRSAAYHEGDGGGQSPRYSGGGCVGRSGVHASDGSAGRSPHIYGASSLGPRRSYPGVHSATRSPARGGGSGGGGGGVPAPPVARPGIHGGGFLSAGRGTLYVGTGRGRQPPAPYLPPSSESVVMVRGIPTACRLIVPERNMDRFAQTFFPSASITARAAARGGGASTVVVDALRDERAGRALAMAGAAAEAAAAAAAAAQAAAARAATGGGRATAAAAAQAAGVAANARSRAAATAAAAEAIVLGSATAHAVQVGEVPSGQLPPRRKRRRKSAAQADEPDLKRPLSVHQQSPAGHFSLGGPVHGSAAAAAVAAAANVVPNYDAPLSPAARDRMMKELQELGVPTPLADTILDSDLTAPLPMLPPAVDRPAVLKVRTKQRNRKSAERSRAKTKHKTTVAKDAAAEVWRECQAVWEMAMRLEGTNRKLQAAVEYARGAHATWTEVQRVLRLGVGAAKEERRRPTYRLGELLENIE